MKRMTKRLLALAMALAIVFAGLPNAAEAASKKTGATKTITVTTQKGLTKALKNGSYTAITIKTDSKKSFTLVEEYANAATEITITAPKATVYCKATFKKINISRVKKYVEYASGNTIVADNADAITIKTDAAAAVKTLKLAGKGDVKLVNYGTISKLSVTGKCSLKLTQNGKLGKTVIAATAKVNIEGSATARIGITVKAKAKNTVVTTKLPVKLTTYAKTELKLTEGAEGSAAVLKKAVDVEVDNNTAETVTVVAADGSKSKVESKISREEAKTDETGEVIEDIDKGDTPMGDIEPEDTPAPTEDPKATEAPNPTEAPRVTDTPNPTATVAPTEEPTPVPTEEPEVTDVPDPTDTPVPTEEPEVTDTSAPTEEPTAVPTEEPETTDAPDPTDTPAPTSTEEPEVTDVPDPTDTPVPTEEPEVTGTPAPTEEPTPVPTEEPEVTDTPEPTDTPAPTPTEAPQGPRVEEEDLGYGGIRKTYYNADNVITSIVETYISAWGSNTFENTIYYDSEYNVIKSVDTVYENGLLISQDVYDANGNPVTHTVVTYDAAGNAYKTVIEYYPGTNNVKKKTEYVNGKLVNEDDAP